MKKIVFMGSGPFALEMLKALYSEYSKKSEIVVFTKEDKPQGRGMKTVTSAIEKFSNENGLEIFKPHTLKKEVFYDDFVKIAPDLVVVASYGLILPQYVIDFPKYGCINVHGSLLPRLRGAAPINRAVIDGEEKTGITIMKMDVGLDTGDMLISDETPISEEDTAGDVFDRLCVIGAPLLIRALRLIEENRAVFTPQDHSKSTYAEKITSETRKIDWNKSSREILNLIRGLCPRPNAFSTLEKQNLSFKFIKARKTEEKIDGMPGEVFADKKRVFVRTGDGAIELCEIQPEGKPKMTAVDLINGRKITSGDRFI